MLEIYGSSETGGIGCRERATGWTLFPGMKLTSAGNRWRLDSPYLPEGLMFYLDDNISLAENGRFLLHGRADRIVKIEEKRLSLTEMEHHFLYSSCGSGGVRLHPF